MTAILLALLAVLGFLALGWVLTIDRAVTRSRRATRAMRDAYKQTRITRINARVRL